MDREEEKIYPVEKFSWSFNKCERMDGWMDGSRLKDGEKNLYGVRGVLRLRANEQEANIGE